MSDSEQETSFMERRAESTESDSEDEMSSRPGSDESEPLIRSDVEAYNVVNARPWVTKEKVEKWRNVVAFWILGLCNNFPYVVMLSAAFDIFRDLQPKNSHVNMTRLQWNGTDLYNFTGNASHIGRDCNRESTSLILLADIFPTFIIKLIAPYFMNFIPYWVRVNFVVVLFAMLSFVLVGLGLNIPLVIFGVICASISSGFGEITFLSFTARYDKSSVAGWASGTGAAGVGGALVYAALTTFLSPKVTLFIQLVMPCIMIATYFLVLGKPNRLSSDVHATNTDSPHHGSEENDKENVKFLGSTKKNLTDEDKEHFGNDDSPLFKAPPIHPQESSEKKTRKKIMLDNIKYIPRLFKYMIPLFVVYAAEYMINQGLFELLFYPGTHLGRLALGHNAQYRWYQVAYQVGVFISRTSIACFYFKFYWVLAILQVLNFVFLFGEAVYLFIPFFWITLFISLYEGLLGGAVYANAFYAITKNVPEIRREFSMGVASVSDTFGITVAAFASLGIHNYICKLPSPR